MWTLLLAVHYRCLCVNRRVTAFSWQWVRRRPMRNSEVLYLTPKTILPAICQLSGRTDADAITAFRAVLPGYCRSRVESHTVSLSLHDRPLEFVADPQSPIIEIPARLRLLPKASRTKNSVVGLEPQLPVQ